ncbi:bfd724cf-dd17-42e5-91e6-a316cf6c4bc6 [Sclerotinia trifoliorum]|uniref:Bfd724cf-dd17-42e5-91e6-a316cf6c4bc6 n=1 Tax=Sclerotinia trifoliorum TaxID=28548 RepID=A0A8H2ZQX6_9HELO|nr:bfd724cf-dd17-42e5-91e6-a316cf6c4bc6 [Sclerotinia trifoliorum]
MVDRRNHIYITSTDGIPKEMHSKTQCKILEWWTFAGFKYKSNTVIRKDVPDTSNSNLELASLAIDLGSFSSETERNHLQNCWTLDNANDTHVTNSAGGSIKTRDGTVNDTILAGANRFPGKKDMENWSIFDRVTWDLIVIKPAYNGDQYASHFQCTTCRLHIVYTHRTKAESVDLIEQFFELVKTQFKSKVRFFHCDGETTLGRQFEEICQRRGVIIEKIASYTLAQNGALKRADAILVRKARSILIGAKLPVSLWKEAFKCAAYLENRIPKKQLMYRSAHEMTRGQAPSYANLHPFGCQAYVLNKSIPKKENMEPRAHIEYLVCSILWRYKGRSHDDQADRPTNQSTEKPDYELSENIQDPTDRTHSPTTSSPNIETTPRTATLIPSNTRNTAERAEEISGNLSSTNILPNMTLTPRTCG